MDIKEKNILITGGSAGIGKALVQELVINGAKNIAVIGRKKKPLEKLKEDIPSANFLLIQGDVSNTSDLDNAVERIGEKWGHVDILINNAGVVSAGLLSETSDEDIIQQITVNITGLILMTKKALPLLKKSKEGAIVNISSGYGYIAMPFYSVYAATKAAVRQFSEAMRRELHQHSIHVMTVYPSATDTGMMKTAVVGKMDSPQEVAELSIKGLIDKNIEVIVGGEERKEQIRLSFMEPEKMDEIAIASYDALERRTRNHRSM